MTMWQKCVEWGQGGLEAIFQSEVLPGRRGWVWVSLAGVYILGIIWFGMFFDWGNSSLEYEDWGAVTAPRMQFLKNAALTLRFPLHISDSSTLNNFTDRYFSVPDTFASPQFILLRWMKLNVFNLANVWLFYTLGFAGLLALRRKLRLSVFSFTLLALLFNFNGHIIAHLGVGHASWNGYFLFSWFVWLVLRLLEGDRTWLWTLGMAGLLLAMWLQGSYHQYVWLLMLLAAIGVFIPRTFWVVIRAGVFTLLLSACRLLPAALLDLNYTGAFFNGYPHVFSLWDSMVEIYTPMTTKFFQAGLGESIQSHETTLFIGLIAAVFLVYFGLYRGLLLPKAPYHELLFPLAMMLILAMGWIFGLVRELPIPMLQGERVSSRIISVVLVFGLVFAAQELQRWLNSQPARPFLAAAGFPALGLVAFDLVQNMNVWKVEKITHVGVQVGFDPAHWVVMNHPDDLYVGMLVGGAVITLITFVVLAWLAWRENRQRR